MMSIANIASGAFAWRKTKAYAERAAKDRGQLDRFPTHTRATLPDGTIMLVRVASLTAAKDLLAAQRAAERELAARRDVRALGEVAWIIERAERDGAH